MAGYAANEFPTILFGNGCFHQDTFLMVLCARLTALSTASSMEVVEVSVSSINL